MVRFAVPEDHLKTAVKKLLGADDNTAFPYAFEDAKNERFAALGVLGDGGAGFFTRHASMSYKCLLMLNWPRVLVTLAIVLVPLLVFESAQRTRRRAARAEEVANRVRERLSDAQRALEEDYLRGEVLRSDEARDDSLWQQVKRILDKDRRITYLKIMTGVSDRDVYGWQWAASAPFARR
jgi:hypothetical protein